MLVRHHMCYLVTSYKVALLQVVIKLVNYNFEMFSNWQLFSAEFECKLCAFHRSPGSGLRSDANRTLTHDWLSVLDGIYKQCIVLDNLYNLYIFF